jgi:hypothetical protein
MNYVTLVNNVLRRLREDSVVSVTSTTYSTLIGDIVNDAKNIVEHSWDWSALRDSKTVTTIAGTNEYTLTGAGEDFKFFYFLDTTNKNNIVYQSKEWIDVQNNVDTPLQGKPNYFSYTTTDSNGDMKVILYPTPDAAYTLSFKGVFRQALLSNNLDIIKVPWIPVMHTAVALAVRERGETGGTNAAEYFSLADKYLSDAIALDAEKHPEEMIYRTV